MSLHDQKIKDEIEATKEEIKTLSQELQVQMDKENYYQVGMCAEEIRELHTRLTELKRIRIYSL